MTSILVIEDEMMLALEIEEDLKGIGYDVSGVAFSGEEALEMARAHMPHLVLMDIKLPGRLDGIEAAEEIQRDLNIPVIFLTGHSEEALIERAKAIDPYGYVLKPFHGGQIRAAIEIALHRKEKEVSFQGAGGKTRPGKFHRLISKPLPDEFSVLTPKEIQVADLIRQGESTKEISRLLRMSHATVTWHRKNIRMKLRLTHRGANLTTELLSLSK